ncbi:MAG: NlpC/P60 family protein [Pseudomonadota bacterium]
MDGARVVAAARQWLGTPYRHQASLKHQGCDCLGLIRGVWRDLLGPEPETPPAYTSSWLELSGREDLLGAAVRHLLPVISDEAKPGDVLFFRIHRSAPAKHVGILSKADRFIHAHSNASVVESALCRSWRERIVARFRYPESYF